MESMKAFSQINEVLALHGLQLERGSRKWCIIKLGEYGKGTIHGYFRSSFSTDLAETLTVYKTSKHRALLITLNTTIWECRLFGGD